MARTSSRAIMGFLKIDNHHHDAIISLIAPATPAHRLLDPFAGEGEFLDVASKAWNVTPYANELDGERAQACIDRFGIKQAVRGDVERLVASNNAFSIGWLNPPYDHLTQDADSKRVEFKYLKHSWKWIAEGGIAMWVVYQHHLTQSASAFLAKHSTSVDVWALPGKHLNAYDQIVVVAIKGLQANPDALYDHIHQQKTNPRLLTVQPEPVYRLPPSPDAGRRFVFTADTVDEQQGLALIESFGAWKTNGFQALLEVPPEPEQIEPIVAPRPGHLALVLAAGVADGAVIETEIYGKVAIRGKTQPVEQVARVDVESDPNDPDRQIKKTTIRLKPTTTLTLLAEDGTLVEMDGDDALLDFITTNKQALAGYLNNKFSPSYDFRFNGLKRFLDKVRLKGKYPLYTAQKHVIAAMTKGFETRKGILLSGQMGCGKTCLGGTSAIAIASGAVQALADQMLPEQVILIVAPPHLTQKWERELVSINPNIVVQQLKRHEDIRTFMEKSGRIGGGIPKIGLIKRDMTKLGCGREVAVVWRKQPVALWKKDQPTPDGYEPHQRIVKKKVPQCPHCGNTVMQERNGNAVPASESWLKSGKRSCSVCHTPLWQEERDRGSRPQAGYKFPPKNPRYRIDEYLKKVYPDRVFLLIWDEVHESANGASGNGEAFGRMAGLAQKVLGLTGTPFNGRASSLFNLEYHLNPRVKGRYNCGGAERLSRKERGSSRFQQVISSNKTQRGRAESAWVSAMGVREQVIEERPTYDSITGAFTGTSTYEKPYTEAPGISPLLVAEMLDHCIFFGLGDLGKYLPRYEEIALPVELDTDIYDEYDRTRSLLKDYLIERRWDGDSSFRGSYLQWSMGWQNAPFRLTEVIHNIRHPITGEKRPHIVTTIPSYGDDRVYNKEKALIDLLTDELEAGRPCVVYLRQTGTRDIQPRIEKLIRDHVPGAVPFVLKNTISAERREKVIDAERAKGMNVLITNPELIKTGLDVIWAPTLIFQEITFNLSTMMQAAARSYRLNQTHEHCKVYYLFAESTMEHTAVQLMSRKQRAAKLLTGDVGLTGLDQITEGESSFESALMDAIVNDEVLLDPTNLFKSTDAQSEIDTEDIAFWNVELSDDENDDPLVQAVIELGGEVDDEPLPVNVSTPKTVDTSKLVRYVSRYLDTVHLIHDIAKRSKLQAKLLTLLEHGIENDDGTRKVVGMTDPEFAQYPVHEETMVRHVTSWLKKHHFVFAACEEDTAIKVVDLGKQALGLIPIKLDVFEKMQDMRDEELQQSLPKREAKPKRRKTVDLTAIPDDSDTTEQVIRPLVTESSDGIPKQLAMF